MVDQIPEAEARGLRTLRRLVTTLTAVMIVGVTVIVVLLAIRLNAPAPPAFPESIALPDDVSAMSVTRGPDFLAVVSEEGRILIFSPDGTTLRQEITVARPE